MLVVGGEIQLKLYLEKRKEALIKSYARLKSYNQDNASLSTLILMKGVFIILSKKTKQNWIPISQRFYFMELLTFIERAVR